MHVGIGIVTYNRLDYLQELVARIRQHTQSPYELVVADDGSTDGTREWLDQQGIPYVTGPNMGIAWNMNRALAYLLHFTDCDVVLTIEDDSRPFIDGWERAWATAAGYWGHVSFSNVPDWILAGSGAPHDPHWCVSFGAHVTATRRDCLEAVGFVDTRFRKWGAEHVHWSWRFRRHLQALWEKRGGPYFAVPCLNFGVGSVYERTYRTEADERRNKVLFMILSTGPIYRDPFVSYEEADQFVRELIGHYDRLQRCPLI